MFIWRGRDEREREERESKKRKKIRRKKIFSLHNLSKKKSPTSSFLSFSLRPTFVFSTCPSRFPPSPLSSPTRPRRRTSSSNALVSGRRRAPSKCERSGAAKSFFSRERGVRDERARESDETFHAFLFLSRDFFFSPSTSRRALRDRPHPFVAVWTGLTHGEGRHETREKKLQRKRKAETKKKRQR